MSGRDAGPDLGWRIQWPLILLILSCVLALTLLLSAGGLSPQQVADTGSYLRASEISSLPGALAHYRTLGYPTLLRLIRLLGLDLAVVPWIQTLVYFAGVILFFFGVFRFTGCGWLALAAAMPLPWAGVMVLCNRIQPDFLAAALTLVAIACLLWLTVSPARWLLWIGVGAGVFLAYQMRPAAIFLVGLVPALGFVFVLLKGVRDRRASLRWALTLAVVTLGPYLMFCGLRWLTVGHFGLVSFGGTNLVGVAANFLDRKLVLSLPVEDRRLAKQILRLRRKRGWNPMSADSETEAHFAQYSENIWKISRTVARVQSRESSGSGYRIVEENARLSRLATAVILQRPALYLSWVSSALVFGLRQLLDYGWILAPGLLLVASWPVLWLRQRPGVAPASRTSSLVAMIVLAVAYFGVYLLLVCLVSFPFYRYFLPMTLFLPSALCAEIFEVWRDILSRL